MAICWLDGFENHEPRMPLVRRYRYLTLSQTSNVRNRQSYIATGRDNHGKCLVFYGTSFRTPQLNTSPSDTLIAGVAFQHNIPSSASVAPFDLMTFYSTTSVTPGINLTFDPTNQIFSVLNGSLLGSNTVLATVTTATVLPDSWYHLQLYGTRSSSVGSVRLYINNNLILNLNNLNANTSDNSGFSYLQFYKGPMSWPYGYKLDDLYICDGSGSSYNDTLGDLKIESSSINSAGTVTANVSGQTSVVQAGSIGNALQSFDQSYEKVTITTTTLLSTITANTTSLTYARQGIQASAVDVSCVVERLDSINSGMVLYYSMDNSSINGSAIADLSGNNKTGTLVGSPSTGQSGYLNQSIEFTTSGQNINCGNLGGLTGDFSVTAWIKLNNYSNYNAVVSKTTSGGLPAPFDFYTSPSTGILNFFQGNGHTGLGSGFQTIVSSSAIPTGAWTHVAGIYKSGVSMTMYINGGSVSSTTSVVTTSVGTDNTLIGSRNDGVTQMNGYIDEVRIYSRALSAAEVATLYQYTGVNNAYIEGYNFSPTPTVAYLSAARLVPARSDYQTGQIIYTSNYSGTAWTYTEVNGSTWGVNVIAAETGISTGGTNL